MRASYAEHFPYLAIETGYNLWWLMLRETNSKPELADIENANTCPQPNPDTYIGTAHSTRESQAHGGIDSESCDRETQPSQQGYDPEEF